MFSKTFLTLSLIASFPLVTVSQVIGNQHQNPYQTATENNSTQLISELPLQQLENIAQAITVQVQVGEDKGSGILIAHQNNTYTVITNAHVVERGSTYTIETPDGVKHSAILVTKDGKETGNDLALLEFNSSNNYQVGTLGDSHNLREGEEVLAAGFPYKQNNLITTRGEIALITKTPLKKGYQIGFTNQTLQGMSGGLLLNSIGEVIGVLGKGKDAIFDTAYDYQDGTTPTAAEIQRLRTVGFSIPIANLVKLSPQLASLLPGNNNGDSPIAQKPKVPKSEIPPQRAEYTEIVGKVDTIAQQITVRIDNLDDNSNGSGVIIAKQGNTYYGLTAKHIVCERPLSKPICEKNGTHQIVTSDGVTHQLDYQKVKADRAWLDLAIFSFKSSHNYEVATLGNYNPEDRWIMVSGFPTQNIGSNGKPERLLTGGRLRKEEEEEFTVKETGSLAKSKGKGQDALVYTNISYGGMSGGAVLDREGRLIGINTGSENDFIFDALGDYSQYSLGLSLGEAITDFLGYLQGNKTELKEAWLKIETIPAARLSETERDSIEKQLLIVEQPKENADIAAWMNYGNRLWRYSRNTEAVKAFEQVIAIDPKFDKAYYAMGLAYGYQGEYQQAVTSLEKATATSNPTPYYYWRHLGAFYRFLKQYDKALAAYDQAINKNEQDFVLYAERGYVRFDLGSYLSKKMLSVSTVIEINVDHVNPYYHYEEAILDYNKAIKINPNNSVSYTNRGLLYINLQQYDKALADFNKSIDINPQYALPYANRGVVYGTLQKYESSLANYTQAIDIDPNFALAYYNRGNIYYRLQKYDQALANYTQAIDIDPNFALAYYNRGNIYYRLQKYDQALANYTQAIDIDPNFALAYNNRGLTYLDLDNFEQAKKDAEEAARLFKAQRDIQGTLKALQLSRIIESGNSTDSEVDPNDAETYIIQDNTYAELQQHYQDLTDYTKAIELNPQDINAYFNRGVTYYNLQKYESALADFNKAIELNPQYPDAYNNRASIYHKFQQYDKALADYRKAIELNQNYAKAYSNRGLIYYDLEQYDKALADHTKAIEIDPKLAQAYINRGVTYNILNNFEQAKKDAEEAARLFETQGNSQEYQNALQISQIIEIKIEKESGISENFFNPNYAEGYIIQGKDSSYLIFDESAEAFVDLLKPNSAVTYKNRGVKYYYLQEYDKALADFTKAIEMYPKYTPAYNNRGVIYYKSQKYEQAIADFTKAIEIDPNDSTAYNNRGLIYDELQQYDQALVDFTKAIKINPNSTVAYINRSFLYGRLEQEDEYEGEDDYSADYSADYWRAIEIDPDSSLIISNRGHSKLQQHKQALEDYTKAIELNPQDAAAYFNRGNSHAFFQRYDQALADFTKAIEINPQDVAAYFNRGLIYYKLQKYEQALADFTKTIEFNPNYAFAYNNRGLIYYKLQKYEQALADFTKTIELNPNYADAYNNRGNTYADLQQYDQALANYTTAIELNPNYAKANFNRGLIYIYLQQYDKGVADFTTAIEIHPYFVDAYNNRGSIYQKQKKWQQALADYNHSFSLTQNLLSIINIGLVKYEQGEIDNAKKQFTLALSKDNQSAEAKLALAVTLFTQGDIESGLSLAEAALKIDQKFADISFLRENLWGENMIFDTEKLLTTPKIQALLAP